MTTCATDKRPVFWQRQTRLPIHAARCVRTRLEEILAHPEALGLLVWPTLLGAPGLLDAHPEGVPEALLLAKAAPMLASVGTRVSPEEAWKDTLARFPDTAQRGASGWLPHEAWASHAAPISLRAGVILLALMGHPADSTFPLRAGVALFNASLYHESHDAFERLWTPSRGQLKKGLQGLIMLAAGFHHLQTGHAPGMLALWNSAQENLGDLEGTLQTPWGRIAFAKALRGGVQRLEWLWEHGTGGPLEPLWELKPPLLEYVP